MPSPSDSTFLQSLMVSEKCRRPNTPKKPLIGLLQMLPLPGAAGWTGEANPLLARVEQEASAMRSAGLHGILLENTMDAPFAKGRLDAAAVVCATQAANCLYGVSQLPFGLSILQNDPETALSMALSLEATFIRVPVLTGTLIAESGMLEGKIHELSALMHQLKMPAGQVKFLVDVTMNHVKPSPSHGTPWRAPGEYFKRLVEAVSQYDLVDSVLLRGQELMPDTLAELRDVTNLPLLVDTQQCTDKETLLSFYGQSDGLLLSQAIKKDPIAGMDPRTTVDVSKMEDLVTLFAKADREVEPRQVSPAGLTQNA